MVLTRPVLWTEGSGDLSTWCCSSSIRENHINSVIIPFNSSSSCEISCQEFLNRWPVEADLHIPSLMWSGFIEVGGRHWPLMKAWSLVQWGKLCCAMFFKFSAGPDPDLNTWWLSHKCAHLTVWAGTHQHAFRGPHQLRPVSLFLEGCYTHISFFSYECTLLLFWCSFFSRNFVMKYIKKDT